MGSATQPLPSNEQHPGCLDPRDTSHAKWRPLMVFKQDKTCEIQGSSAAPRSGRAAAIFLQSFTCLLEYSTTVRTYTSQAGTPCTARGREIRIPVYIALYVICAGGSCFLCTLFRVQSLPTLPGRDTVLNSWNATSPLRVSSVVM